VNMRKTLQELLDEAVQEIGFCIGVYWRSVTGSRVPEGMLSARCRLAYVLFSGFTPAERFHALLAGQRAERLPRSNIRDVRIDHHGRTIIGVAVVSPDSDNPSGFLQARRMRLPRSNIRDVRIDHHGRTIIGVAVVSPDSDNPSGFLQARRMLTAPLAPTPWPHRAQIHAPEARGLIGLRAAASRWWCSAPRTPRCPPRRRPRRSRSPRLRSSRWRRRPAAGARRSPRSSSPWRGTHAGAPPRRG